MSESPQIDDAIKTSELAKIRLEVEKLKEPTPRHELLLRLVPLVTALVAVAGFLWGIAQFASEQKSHANKLAADLNMHAQDIARDQEANSRQIAADLKIHAETIANQRNELDTKTEQEFRQIFWKERLADYREVTKLAATIAMSNTPGEVEVTRSDYWIYYYGELSLIEDINVFVAMVNFGQQLRIYEEGQNNETQLLRELSYKLARACRHSLKNTWEPVTLEDFPEEFPVK